MFNQPYGSQVGLAAPVNAKREPTVRKKAEALMASLELMEKSIIELENKLHDVMSPEAPVLINDNAVPQETCAFADMLQSRIRQAEYLRGRIDAIVTRLEI